MNYQHSFHAGNFADVVKHVTLIALLNAFLRKTTPFCYIDTHAGAGYYDLFSEFAGKKQEHKLGIEKVIQAQNPPFLIKTYLQCVRQINNQRMKSKFASMRYYPGSPVLAHFFMRSQDRVIACELQPNAYQDLRQAFIDTKQVAVHHLDGFLSLKAFLPPRERRGLILIDPPYENPEEYTRIAQHLSIAMKRFPTGTYAIWYPIKDSIQTERFHRVLRSVSSKPIFVIEMTIYPNLPQHLNGCGMAILNPPWQFDEAMKSVLPWLWKVLSINKLGGYRTIWLN